MGYYPRWSKQGKINIFFRWAEIKKYVDPCLLLFDVLFVIQRTYFYCSRIRLIWLHIWLLYFSNLFFISIFVWPFLVKIEILSQFFKKFYYFLYKLSFLSIFTKKIILLLSEFSYKIIFYFIFYKENLNVVKLNISSSVWMDSPPVITLKYR